MAFVVARIVLELLSCCAAASFNWSSGNQFIIVGTSGLVDNLLKKCFHDKMNKFGAMEDI
jgi:hypothetical protein